MVIDQWRSIDNAVYKIEEVFEVSLVPQGFRPNAFGRLPCTFSLSLLAAKIDQ
jgi:hypothetical protein